MSNILIKQGYIGIFLFVIFNFISMIIYPGGTIIEPESKGYSFFYNFLSNLGEWKAKNGEDNTASAYLFNSSMLILALFYFMYLLSWKIIENKNTVIKISSLIVIVGAINLPIIKFSVNWWNTLHQGPSLKIIGETTIHSSMLIPLGIMTAAFALFSLLIFLMKFNTEMIRIKNKGLDRL